MKLRLPLISVLAMLYAHSLLAQVTVNNTYTVQQLVEDFLIGEGVEVDNITINGQPASTVNTQAGIYDGPSNVINFPQGLVMATGNAVDVVTGSFGGGMTNPVYDDPDLVAISGQSINDAIIIEFDFLSTSDSIKFNYVFASNEYPGYTCSNFNDAFGFFLSGPGINGPYTNNAINIALIPGTEIPVAINTINSGTPSGGNPQPCLDANPNFVEDSQYFVSNSSTPANDVQFPGMTTTLTALADVDCGEWYHIKLAIGDASDGALDSGVFLEAGSFAAFGDVFVNVVPTIGGNAVSNPSYDSVLVAGCSEAYIELTRPSGLTIDSVWVEFTGTAIEQIGEVPMTGADYTLTADGSELELEFPTGVDTIAFTITTIWDSIPGENEFIAITIFYFDGCGELNSASDTIFFVDPYHLSSSAPTVVVTCPADQVLISAEGLEGIDPYFYDWVDILSGEDLSEVMVDVPVDSIYYHVGISDACAFEVKFDSVLVINNIPDPLQATIDPFTDPLCTNEPISLNASIQDGNGDYTIIWADGKGNGYAPNTSIVVQNINSTLILEPEIVGYTASLPVYLTVVDTCGTMVNDTIHINYPFIEPLSASFTPLTEHCPTEAVVVSSQVDGGAGEYFYNWYLENGTFGPGADVNSSYVHVIQAGGLNKYTLTVTDFCNRLGQDYRMLLQDVNGADSIGFSGFAYHEDSVQVIKLDMLMNVITPNGDNKNDFFAVEGITEFEDSRVEVYDRWGKIIFETDNYMAGNPSIKPDNAFDADGFGDGTYFYVINVNSGECVTSGTIEVLRNNN